MGSGVTVFMTSIGWTTKKIKIALGGYKQYIWGLNASIWMHLSKSSKNALKTFLGSWLFYWVPEIFSPMIL